MKILCKECALDIERQENLPASMGRATCEECGLESPECYELETDEDDGEQS